MMKDPISIIRLFCIEDVLIKLDITTDDFFKYL